MKAKYVTNKAFGSNLPAAPFPSKLAHAEKIAAAN